MKHALFGVLCVLALQGCAGSSRAPSTPDSAAPPPNAASARPTAAGMDAGGCQQLYGRPSPFGSCRDS